MIRNILIGVLAAGVIGTGVWGYNEHQEKEALVIQGENTYQRAFHDLTYRVDLIHDELGSTLAMNSKERLSPSLSEVWKITSEAQNDIGQFPLVLSSFSKTEEFLYKLGEFSYRHAVRDFDEEPLTEDEYENLKTLYSQSKDIQTEMRNVQSKVLKDDVRWMDINDQLQAQDEPLDNSIIDGFHIIDEKVGAFSEVDFGAGDSHLSSNAKEIAENLSGEEINEEEARDKAAKFLGLGNKGNIDIEMAGEGLEYEAYTVTVPDEKHDTTTTMDITKKGGHAVWMLNERDVEEQKISLNEASEKAKAFLERNEYDSMQLVDSKQYDNIGVFEFVVLKDDVRIYSDGIILEVALDQGDVIGFEAFPYLANYKKDRDLEVTLTQEEAEENLNPHLDVKEHHLGVIENQLEEEVLCHEFYGVIDQDTYRIFINAKNGREEGVQKMQNPERIFKG
ncbi:germination protein YpeB [Salipaludibacillus sp. CF4.18]|uniref:germination protein YpeB n=1 Tax=Salipaludibacillus sp. CF4.18 TaxID=3373081 RepID=UPI003EE6EB32